MLYKVLKSLQWPAFEARFPEAFTHKLKPVRGRLPASPRVKEKQSNGSNIGYHDLHSAP